MSAALYRRRRPGRTGARGLTGLALALSLVPSLCFGQLIATDLPAVGKTAATVTLSLSWSQPVEVAFTPGPGELIMRADQPLDHSGFVALAPRLTPWVSGIFLGYDSLVMKLVPGARAETRPGSSGVSITLSVVTPGRQRPAARPSTSQSSRRRLQFLKASLLWSTGDAWPAAELLRQMSADRPDDAEILAARSLVESRVGRWRLASSHLDRSRVLQGLAGRGELPVDGDINAPGARVEVVQEEQQGGAKRTGLRAGGHAFLLAGLRLLLDYEYAHVGASAAHLAKIGARHDMRSGSWVSASARAASQSSGAVADGELWDRFGATRLSLAWNEPRWELPVLVALGATRDAIGLKRSLRSWSEVGRVLRGDVSGELSAHLERWHARDEADGLSDLFANVSIRYNSWYARPRLWAEYAVSHLHVIEVNSGGGGLASALTRSHVHALTVGVVHPLWRWLQVSGFGGYALSYWGDDAALYGAALWWQPPTGLRGSVHFRQGLDSSTYGRATQALHGRLAVAF